MIDSIISRSLRIIAATTQVIVAIVLLSSETNAQGLKSTPPRYDNPSHSREPAEVLKSIDDLMHERLDRENLKFGSNLTPELIRLEANYVRTDAPTGEVVLHEASFNLQPRYMSFSPQGRRQTDTSKSSAQSVMYFSGSARTPLSLPLVSNLSNVLSGEDASYIVYIGVLPLPRTSASSSKDSLRFYCILERAIESNRSDADPVRFERYAKEFSVKIGDPIRLRLENTPPDRQAYIVRLDDNQTLNFFEDFARHFKEDIILNGERLNFSLGKATVSPRSSRLSIPYTIAYPSHIKLDLLSVVDPAHPLTLVDSVVPPADYLAEHDMKAFQNGTYRYHLLITEIGSGKTIFDETKNVDKSQALLVGSAVPIAGSDTLEVGGKKVNAMKMLKELSSAYQMERTRTERLDATLQQVKGEKEELKKIVEANTESTISGIRVRAGLGFGHITGTSVFVGVESAMPALTLDLSFGVLYSSSVPYLSYEQPSNFSQIFQSPKSLGLQIGWAPISLFGGVVSPVVRIGYYGIYSAVTANTPTGIHSAAIISPEIGITSTPGGIGSDFGFDVTFGPAFGLGINKPAEFGVSAKFYFRF